jgi:hypothetical protein
MAKTVLKLKDDDEYDFVLVGIVCQQKDYRLCHELNKELELELKRVEDFEIQNARRSNKSLFSFFQYENKDADVFYVFSNKGKDDFLLPEHRNVDYLLMIKENFKRLNETQLLGNIKKISIVLGAYGLEVKKLKSKGNLVF